MARFRPDGRRIGGGLLWVLLGAACCWPATAAGQSCILDGTPPQLIPPADVSVDCSASTDPAATGYPAAKLYWADEANGRIQRANLDGSSVETLFDTAPAPTDVALDIVGGRIYWTSAAGNVIQRALLDGSSVEPLVGALAPQSLALDLGAGKIYWADAGGLRRAGLDGSGAETLVAGSDGQGVALDLAAGRVYWTAVGPGCTCLRSADLDGGDVQTLASGLTAPREVAVDAVHGKVYWADGVTVQRANLDGSGPQTLVSGLFSHQALIVDPPGGKFYWSDAFTGTLRRADLDGSSADTLAVAAARGLDLVDPVADDCDDEPLVTFSDQVSGSCPSVITRTWTATDDFGNAASAVQLITVEDTTAPGVTCPDDVEVDCDASIDPQDTGSASAKDDCDPAPAIEFQDQDDPTGCGTAGTIIRTWTASDACGNQGTCQQLITYTAVPPQITCPPEVTIACGASSDPADTGTAVANCTAGSALSFEDQEDLAGCSGTITRTWTATDDCGGSISCEQTLLVEDAGAPQITCPPDISVLCHQPTDPTATGLATASDDCGEPPAVTFEDLVELDACAGTTGTITRTWTAADGCGHSASCDQLLTVTNSGGVDFPCSCVQQFFSIGGAVFSDAEDPFFSGQSRVTVRLECAFETFETHTNCAAGGQVPGLWLINGVSLGHCVLSFFFDPEEVVCDEAFHLCQQLECEALPFESIELFVDQDMLNMQILGLSGYLDINDDELITVAGDLQPFADCLFGGTCPTGACRSDCNRDGVLSIIGPVDIDGDGSTADDGDLQCFADCIFGGQCEPPCTAGPAPTRAVLGAGEHVIGGAVVENLHDPLFTALAGVEVLLEGPRRVSTRTNEWGAWSVSGLPEGRYRVTCGGRAGRVITVDDEHGEANRSLVWELGRGRARR